MLVRITGGSSGIKDYLENGQKQGREYTRDELDERVILDGDLSLTDSIINNIDTHGERYLHITLAFKEDEISRETLEAITQDFKTFTFSAFNEDEYSFYAEAHLAKIKNYTHAKTGEFVERKPHIHIVIPKYNLLSGESLNPFGLVKNQVKYLEAIQETINDKYGLASPKDNKRALFTDDSELLSRYKGDFFKGSHKELKNELLAEMLNRKVARYDDFKHMLSERGEVKTRNPGKDNEYLWVNGVNLRDPAFKRDFIELSHHQKLQRLAMDSHYITSGGPREPAEKYQKALQEWHDTRAKEIKYVYLGKRREFDEYAQAAPDKKRVLLSEREQRFYETHNPEKFSGYSRADSIRDNLRTASRYLETASRNLEFIKPTARDYGQARRNVTDRRNRGIGGAAIERANRETAIESDRGVKAARKTSVTGQLRHDKKATTEQQRGNQEFAEIKRSLDAKRLLDRLSHSHGVNPEKYEISRGQDGGDRIKAGTRNLNVSDFLTKELNLDYRTAGQILRAAYREQTGREPALNPKQPARAALWQAYQRGWKAKDQERKAEAQAKRENQLSRRQGIKQDTERKLAAIRANRGLSPAERKAATSLVKMQKVQAETALREQARIEREKQAEARADEYKNGYKNWLAEQAQGGNEAALAELRRQQDRQPQAPEPDERAINAGEQPPTGDQEPIHRQSDIRYRVSLNGDVTYSRAGRDLLTDQGKTLKVHETDSNTLETGLRLAQAKFGRVLEVQGSDEFKRQTALVAVAAGLNVEFTDKGMNKLMETHQTHLAELKAREAELRALARAEREKATTAAKPQEITPKEKEQVKPEIAPTAPVRAAPTMEVKRQEAIAQVAKLTGRELIERRPGANTRHTGEVLHVTETHAVQAISRNEVIAHELSRLAERPAVSDRMTVQYRQGQERAQVKIKGREGPELSR
ncbi:LPD7 domain-containing protein [Methylobacter luteus]|uniref:LPD7 domain-containing protein n=1 Tax=Methylobacter luteus TaxID=415 RepID=UPI00040DD951|nr:LPD7 domain-containing protein [Methylobacter luteus]